MRDQALLHEARAIAQPWQDDYSRILELIGDSRYVLLGEMSHGTHEFYKIRAEISKKLEHSLNEFRRGYLQRAIGVIYKPETERLSHYFRAILPDQFDAMLHIDRTRAVEPLETTPEWHAGEEGETYPTGL